MCRVGVATVALAVVGGLCQAAGEGATIPGRIQASDVYVRTGPSTNHERLGKLQNGDRVDIRRRLGDWYEIAVPAKFDVFISAKYVDVQGETGTVTGDRVNVRPGTDPKAGLPLGQCWKGDRLTIRRTVGEWYVVAPPARVRAYVFAKLVAADGAVPAGTSSPAPTPKVSPPRGGAAPVLVERDEAHVEPAGSRDVPDSRLREGTAALVEELKKPLAQWRFARARELLTAVSEEGTPSEQRDALRLLTEIESLEHLREGERAIEEIGSKRRALEDDLVRLPGPEASGGGERPKYLAVGWIVDQGVFLGRHGTHKLVQGNRTRYYLLSNTYDLDGYINRRVGIVKGRVERLPEGSGADLITVEELEVLGK